MKRTKSVILWLIWFAVFSVFIVSFLFVNNVFAGPVNSFFQFHQGRANQDVVIQIESNQNDGSTPFRLAVYVPQGGNFNPSQPDNDLGGKVTHGELSFNTFADAYIEGEKIVFAFGGPGTRAELSLLTWQGSDYVSQEQRIPTVPLGPFHGDAIVGLLIASVFMIGWKVYL